MRTSIYLTPAIAREIEARERDGNRSATVRRCVERYVEICRRHRPELRDAEYRSICEALADLPAISAGLVHAHLAEASDFEALAANYGVDGCGLVRRISGLEYADRVALVDAIERGLKIMSIKT